MPFRSAVHKTCPEKISSEKKGVGSTGPKKADDVAGTPQNLTTVVPPLSVGFVNRDLEYEIGKELGLRNGKEIPTSVVQSVIRGADQGNRGEPLLTRLVDQRLNEQVYVVLETKRHSFN